MSRLFLRNCINNGLPVIESDELASALSDDINLAANLAVVKRRLAGARFISNACPRHCWTSCAMAAFWRGCATPYTRKFIHDDSDRKDFGSRRGEAVSAGHYVEVSPDWCFTVDDTIGLIMKYHQEVGLTRLVAPERLGIFYDHFAPLTIGSTPAITAPDALMRAGTASRIFMRSARESPIRCASSADWSSRAPRL